MMNNNEKLNPNEDDALANGSVEGSETSASSPVRGTETHPETSASNSSPAPFESRRARRMSETSMMRQVPMPERKAPTPAVNEDKDKKVAPTPPVPSLTFPTLTKNAVKTPETPVSKIATGSGITTPQSNPYAPKPAAVTKPSKEYWGGTAMLTSLLVFLGAQVIAAFVLIAYIIFGDLEVLKSIQDGTGKVEDMIGSTPWLLIFTQVLSYGAWLGCMWWVSRYRSGVQRGKKFWDAFKKNFRLTVFKPIDIAYGVGIAAVMVGLQFFVLNVLPNVFPSMRVEEAGNTNIFTNFEGPWFYIIAFGIGGLLGPICEELFFRGFLLRGFSNHFSYKNSGRNMDLLEDGLAEHGLNLKSMVVSYRSFTHRHRYILSAIVTSIIFGMMHYQGHWLTVAFTALLGAVFAFVTLKLNRLYPAMIAHVLYNSTLFVILAVTM